MSLKVLILISILILVSSIMIAYPAYDCNRKWGEKKEGGRGGEGERAELKAAFKDKVVVITGASSGIGADLARSFAELEAHVVLAARRQSLLEEIGAECHKLGAASVLLLAVDLGDAGDCARLIAAVQRTHGSRLHALILNHAIADDALLLEYQAADLNLNPHHHPQSHSLKGAGDDHEAGKSQDPDNVEEKMIAIAENVVSQYEKIARINLLTMPALIRLAFPAVAQSRGHIAVISSGSTYAPVPFQTAYVASKFGLNGMVASLHEELAALAIDSERFSLGLVIVGLVNTPMISIRNSSVLEQSAITPQQCAHEIICSVDRRDQLAFAPWHLRLVLPYLRFLPSALISAMTHEAYVALVPDFLQRIEAVKDQLIKLW